MRDIIGIYRYIIHYINNFIHMNAHSFNYVHTCQAVVSGKVGGGGGGSIEPPFDHIHVYIIHVLF